MKNFKLTFKIKNGAQEVYFEHMNEVNRFMLAHSSKTLKPYNLYKWFNDHYAHIEHGEF